MTSHCKPSDQHFSPLHSTPPPSSPSPMPPYTILCGNGTTPTLNLYRRGSKTAHQTLKTLTLPTSHSITYTSTHIHALSLNTTQTTTSILSFTPPRITPHSRTPPPEPLLTSLKSSHDETLLVASGKSGRLYIWSLIDGTLLRSWQAHIRSADIILFTDDDTGIISAGEDSTIHIFDIYDVLDVSRVGANPPRPWKSLPGHSMPILDMCVGMGGISARLMSVSRDETCRIWHLASGRCIATVLLEWVPRAVVMTSDEKWGYIGGRGIVKVDIGNIKGVVAMKRLEVWGMDDVCAMDVAQGEKGVVVGGEGGVKVWEGGRVVDLLDKGVVVDVKVMGEVAGGKEIRLGKVPEVFDPVVGGGTERISLATVVVERSFGGEKRGERGEAAVKEIEELRRRNAELEEAGRKLLALVENR